MRILVKAGGLLLDYLRPDVDAYTRAIETEPGQTLEAILAGIGIRPVHVAMVFVDARLRSLDYVPKEGDVITLRPPVAGG